MGLFASLNISAIREKIPFDASNVVAMSIDGLKMLVGLVLAAGMALIAGVTQFLPKLQELLSGGGPPKKLNLKKKQEEEHADFGIEN
mmetsp:Transcript_24646/g.38318  ORF Transcript_24646/g.38318 Transcript_24646/m.38318 type:complete len:87 (+) Transcript_24646:1367-1627(+)